MDVGITSWNHLAEAARVAKRADAREQNKIVMAVPDSGIDCEGLKHDEQGMCRRVHSGQLCDAMATANKASGKAGASHMIPLATGTSRVPPLAHISKQRTYRCIALVCVPHS